MFVLQSDLNELWNRFAGKLELKWMSRWCHWLNGGPCVQIFRSVRKPFKQVKYLKISKWFLNSSGWIILTQKRFFYFRSQTFRRGVHRIVNRRALWSSHSANARRCSQTMENPPDRNVDIKLDQMNLIIQWVFWKSGTTFETFYGIESSLIIHHLLVPNARKEHAGS